MRDDSDNLIKPFMGNGAHELGRAICHDIMVIQML